MTENTTKPDNVAELSLAEYRALREAPPASAAETRPAADSEQEDNDSSPLGAADALGESAASDDADETQESDSKDTPKRKGGWQRRIERLTAENQRLSEQLATKNAEKPAPEAKEKPAEVVELAKPDAFAKPKPKLEDFESLEEFTDSLTDWKLEAAEAKRAAQSAQARQREAVEAVQAKWQEREAAAKKTHRDYADVLHSVDDIPLSPDHQRIFLDSEVGPEVAYALASDPDRLKEFAALSPLEAAKVFGRLEAEYSADRTPSQETKVSNAPRPIRPVGGRASSTAALDVGKMSLAEYRKAREAGRIR